MRSWVWRPLRWPTTCRAQILSRWPPPRLRSGIPDAGRSFAASKAPAGLASRRPPPPPLAPSDEVAEMMPVSTFISSSASSSSVCPVPSVADVGAPTSGFCQANDPSGKPDMTNLTQQVEPLVYKLLPTAEMESQKANLANTLKPLLERHTGGVLHFFGSCDNGFWMKGSDVDACLVVGHCEKRQSWLTKLRLVQCLVERDKIGTAQVVGAARVPVAKVMVDADTELCDISVNNVAALENSRFVGAFAGLDPRVQTLGRCIKHWASRRRINNRSEGTLSTYTLILQLFYFLQTRDMPVLPLVVDLLSTNARQVVNGQGGDIAGCAAGPRDGKIAAEAPRAVNHLFPGPEMDVASGELRPSPFLADADAIRQKFPSLELNKESIGELLYGFFQFWGQEPFRGSCEGSGQTVYVYDGTRELNDLGVLVMRCPLTGKNVNPFTSFVWQAIHAEFERAASLLAEGKSLQELCEAAEESPAGRGPRASL